MKERSKSPGRVFQPARLCVLTIFLASLVLYLNALPNGFVFDDIDNVVNNPWIRGIRYVPEFFSTHLAGFDKGFSTSYYRPLVHLIYVLGYFIFGLKAWGFHLINVIFHAGASVLVFLITARLFERARLPVFTSSLWLPFLAAMLFAAHPIHTEAVAWVAGVMDVSFTFFYLLSLHLYIESAGDDFSSKGAYLLSVVSFFFASLCKEPALTLPLALVVYDWTFRREGVGLASYVKRYIPYGLVMGIYLIMRTNALGGFAPIKTKIELTPYEYLVNILVLLGQYLEKLFFPMNLNVYHVFHPVTSLISLRGTMALLALAVFGGVAFLMAKKNRVVFFGLFLIVIPLLPGLYIPALTQGLENAFTERYLYLPSFGFVLLLAGWMGWVWVKRPKRMIILTGVACAVLGLYSVGTVRRNPVWKDNYTLWCDAVKKSPGSAQVHQNLGYALYLKDWLDEAIEQYRIALSLEPNLFDAQINLGVAFHQKGLLDQAMDRYLIALKLRPNSAEANNNLGLALVARGLIDEAIEHCQVAVKLKPNFANAHNNLGVAFGSKGIVERALREFETAVRLDPENLLYRDNLAKAYETRK